MSRLPGDSGSVTEAGSKDTPRIILVGHSAGGWSMLKVARDLRDKGIPIELVVLLDSVGITDPTVPRNVKAIAVFHARGILMFLTSKNIRIENPQNTTVIANLVVKGASHLSITRDPQVRDVVLSTVDALLQEMHSYPTPSR
jgi:pimeloyl-ACP methyl ester carboxylesterase